MIKYKYRKDENVEIFTEKTMLTVFFFFFNLWGVVGNDKKTEVFGELRAEMEALRR